MKPLNSHLDWRPLLLATPALVLLAVFFIGPVLYLARLSLYEGGGSSGFGIGSGGFYQPNTWSLSSYINLLTESIFVMSFCLRFCWAWALPCSPCCWHIP